MDQFPRISRLPPYVFNMMDQLKQNILDAGHDIFDLGIGNPDQPTPPHIVEAMIEAVQRPLTHRYSASKGIKGLRTAICDWYTQKYNVDLDPETEAIATIGSKEGLAHLMMAMVDTGDTVLVPNPCYPVHHFGFVLANADICHIPLTPGSDFIADLQNAIAKTWPKPKVLIINFPCNPTAQCVDLEFFSKIIAIAKEHNIWVIHDLAYADIVFDGYVAPSILQVPGAKDIAVEFYTLSKSYNMPGWRAGFMCGNAKLVAALSRFKSYIDYGSFTPVQVGAIAALTGPQDCVTQICDMYRERRDALCAGLNAAGWSVTPPKATMFVWAGIPEMFAHLGSLEFAKLLFKETNVVVAPGVGFGAHSDQYVRFALVEDANRLQQATQNIQKFLQRAQALLTIPEVISA
jgi:alanine-synthesizing transaminase